MPLPGTSRRPVPHTVAAALRGYLYVLEDRGGLVSCYDPATGKQLYPRADAGRGLHVVAVGLRGKVFCLETAGRRRAAGGPEFKVLGQNALDETCWSSPAVAGGALFLAHRRSPLLPPQAVGAE